MDASHWSRLLSRRCISRSTYRTITAQENHLAGSGTEAFGQAELAELAATIRAHGILEAIGVIRDGDGYLGLWGHRRWMASELAGLELIPAVVRDKPHRSRSDGDSVNREYFKGIPPSA